MKKFLTAAAVVFGLAAGPLAVAPAFAEDAPATTAGPAATADPSGEPTSPAADPTPTPDPTQTSAQDPTQTPTQDLTPTSDPTPTPDPTPTGEPEPAAFAVPGAIGAKWAALEGAAGDLGAPTAEQACADGLCSQEFEGGAIFWTSATGAHAVLQTAGRTGPAWYAKGGLAAVGYPLTDEAELAGGTIQKFSTGRVLAWSGAKLLEFSTRSGIGSRWLAAGGETVLGLPVTAEGCGLKASGCYQQFARGTVYWAPGVGGHVVWGGIRGQWEATGAQNGVLGYPTGEESCGLPGNGCVQQFQGGRIYWSGPTGAHVIRGGIGSRWTAAGATRSMLGFPLTNEQCGQAAQGCVQRFQGGSVYWSSATGAWLAGRGIVSKYLAAGGPGGSLGYPISNERCSGGSCAQSYQRGDITWSGSAGARVYPMSECHKLNNGQSKYSTYGANRVLITWTGGYGQSHATNMYCKSVAGTYVQDWRTDGYVGASGFKPPGVPSGPTRNLFSPTGSFSVTEAFGLGNPGTKLPYRTLNPRSRWGGNPWTPTYNKYHESSSWVGYDENMWWFASLGYYRQGVVINYNRPNIVQDAGFAIFLHMKKIPTAGCISLDDWAVVDYLRKSTPGDRILMGTYGSLFR
ncbi:hypothetical protein [Arthrobacter sp. Soil763]|uniref:hypothetical protein n=1 Tax=Arthrobacter sp. Soil763 TaxID=1736402 RepID=UPI0006FE6C52|nr:hypothetical protein [Arthrobacter sp. Soil763]KRE79482.1 hypothetical protein ASG71_05230 [Arthrobacter sp. Soil763]